MAVRFCRDGQDLFGLSTGIPRIPPADPGLGDSGQPPQVAQYTRSPIPPTRQRLQAPQNAPPGLMSQLRMEKGWGKVLEACRSLPTDCHLPVFRLGMPAVDFAPFEEHLRATCGGMLASSDVPRRSNTTCCRFPTLGLPMYVPSPRRVRLRRPDPPTAAGAASPLGYSPGSRCTVATRVGRPKAVRSSTPRRGSLGSCH